MMLVLLGMTKCMINERAGMMLCHVCVKTQLETDLETSGTPEIYFIERKEYTMSVEDFLECRDFSTCFKAIPCGTL